MSRRCCARAQQCARRFATCRPARRSLAAVSGGADSLALAAALAHVATKSRLIAGAVVVDHGLQPGSAEQAAARRRRSAAASASTRSTVCTVAVGRAGGPEAAARAARYAALDARRRRRGAARAHPRRPGRDGAARPGPRLRCPVAVRHGRRRRGRYRRPFLGVRRTETRAACRGARPASRGTTRTTPTRRTPGCGSGARCCRRSRRRSAGRRRGARPLGASCCATTPTRSTSGPTRPLADGLGAAPRCRAARRCAPGCCAARRSRPARRPALSRRDTSPRWTGWSHDWHGQGPVSLPGGLVAERSYDRLLLR